jgi:MFS family permease
MSIVGTACGVLPVTRLMQGLGRKPIFIGASLIGAVVTMAAALCIQQRHFYGLVLCAFLLGGVMSAVQQIRFAAMESVSPDLMPKATSTVLLGGLVAAILGPELVTLGQFVSSQDFVGAFYLMSVLLVICSLLFTQINNTHVAAKPTVAAGRTLKEIARQPVFILAVSASVVGYALMSFIMTATPVHMHVVEGHTLQQTKWVIQSHIFAMFFPSIFSGSLISKLGVHKVIYLGLCAYVATIIVALTGSDLVHYWVPLVLLGIGWNFLFLGGTVLLAKSYHPDERFRVQGINEILVFGCQATAALSAGLMLELIQWQGLLLCSFLIIGLQVVLMARLGFKQNRMAIF